LSGGVGWEARDSLRCEEGDVRRVGVRDLQLLHPFALARTRTNQERERKRERERERERARVY